jgi:hypothetical protein
VYTLCTVTAEQEALRVAAAAASLNTATAVNDSGTVNGSSSSGGSSNDDDSWMRDQGFTRPKVNVILS